MHRLSIVACSLTLVGACSSAPASQTAVETSGTVLFEGARLIVGDESAPIESAAFLVENDTITRVGRTGEVAPPDGAARVDLAGKTVMPAIIEAHGHLGYRKGASSTASPPS
jgi:imidazolonepropionase-like amidohydrolase